MAASQSPATLAPVATWSDLQGSIPASDFFNETGELKVLLDARNVVSLYPPGTRRLQEAPRSLSVERKGSAVIFTAALNFAVMHRAHDVALQSMASEGGQHASLLPGLGCSSIGADEIPIR